MDAGSPGRSDAPGCKAGKAFAAIPVRSAADPCKESAGQSEESNEMTHDKHDDGSSFGWFLAGLGIGAALGVLFAPKPGRETREELAEGMREGGEYLRQQSRVAAEQLNNLVATGKEQMSDYVEKGRKIVERGRGQMGEYVDLGKQKMSEHADRVAAAIDAGKQAYQSTTGSGERS
jgi:gas vesicle protein